MKKFFTIPSLLLSLTLCLVVAVAAGGDANDPLLSLSYLEGIFRPEVNRTIDTALDISDQEILQDTQTSLQQMANDIQVSKENFATVAQQVTLNERDTLSGSTGLCVTAHAGSIVVQVASGTVVDVTIGQEVASGATLTANHRYVIAEDSTAVFVSTSPTAVLSYQGAYTHTTDDTTIDYYGIALALRELGLFRGSGSGIGEGFDLHLAPTRAEALVMFIRMLGEEDEALACTYEHPFTDVPKWLDRYAAWAWHHGYSNGIGNNQFGAASPVSVVEYQEFILRALGYSVAGIDNYLTSLERARTYGALTDAEYTLLSNSTFLRAHVAYLSYYNLDTVLSGTYLTLGQQLQQQRVFSFQQLIRAKELVSSTRLK